MCVRQTDPVLNFHMIGISVIIISTNMFLKHDLLKLVANNLKRSVNIQTNIAISWVNYFDHILHNFLRRQ